MKYSNSKSSKALLEVFSSANFPLETASLLKPAKRNKKGHTIIVSHRIARLVQKKTRSLTNF